MKSDLDMNRLIERIRRLPPDKVREVCDFAGFLEGFGTNRTADECRVEDTEWSLYSLTAANRGDEEEDVAYSIDDLKERWQ